ncbi:MAG: hypothetical protein AB1486_33665, partial [Planctomycetota bacterium]
LSPQDPSLPAQGLEVTEEGIRIVTAGTFGELMEKFIGGLRENLPAEALHQIGLGDLTATGAGGFDSLPAPAQELLAGLLIEANDFLLSGASGYSISELGRLRLTNGMHWAAAFLNRDAGSFSFWEGTQLALDALALSEVPFASQAAGFASAAIDLGRGDWGWGAAGLAGTIPFLGSASDAARLARSAKRAATEGVSLFHGTDIATAVRFLEGEGLDAAAAAARSSGASPGFYLATHVADAEHFALIRAPGGVVEYRLSGSAVEQLNAAGARLGPIAPGAKGFPTFQGQEYVVPTSAFDRFSTLREAGEIVVVPR